MGAEGPRARQEETVSPEAVMDATLKSTRRKGDKLEWGLPVCKSVLVSVDHDVEEKC